MRVFRFCRDRLVHRLLFGRVGRVLPGLAFGQAFGKNRYAFAVRSVDFSVRRQDLAR